MIKRSATYLLSCIVLCAALGPMGAAAQDLAGALDQMRAGNWSEAEDQAQSVSPLARDIIDWHGLRAGRGDFDAYHDFLTRNADWPGLRLMRRVGERAIGPRTPRDRVLDYFGVAHAQTPQGALHLADAHRAAGRTQDAADEIVLSWRTHAYSSAEQKLFLREFGPLLAPHHTARMDMLLWRGRLSDAERLMPHVSKDVALLAKARIGLRRKVNGVDALIAAVPKDLRGHPGLAYERFVWRLDKGREEAARDLLLEVTETAEGLGEPNRWAGWRRYLAREALREGDPVLAYRLASTHHLMGGSNFADLEWLAGFISLEFLDEPAQALRHFQTFRGGVASPISLGRAGYWEGRAHEALGEVDNALVSYAFAAEYQTSFYGQLAAERAGLPMDGRLAGAAPEGGWLDAGFRDSTVLAAALALHQAGALDLAERFLVNLAETQTEGDLALLGELALQLDEPHLAVMIAKQAARMGVVLPRPYFPLAPDFTAAATQASEATATVPPELILAIIRRESEFDPKVVSGAGARGLMQLMPRTAQALAGDLELEYSADKLLTDPAYNASLGTQYLADLARQFDGNVVLIAAAYNAGPSRAERWIRNFGDPRDPSVDVVRWIESIPFRETRNYVMRVAESLPVYRARLAGETLPLTLLAELKT